MIHDEFSNVVEEYNGEDSFIDDEAPRPADRLDIEIEHVDGTFNAKSRSHLLDWLNADTKTRIPLEAYDYVVNGKPALEWVMERQVVAEATILRDIFAVILTMVNTLRGPPSGATCA
jgi:predicted helicase